ncbi:unnamed protein product [Phytophthora fragariaefolia]|uniref:Unnamed protein product n=1 Tax=Phytophthora fragariaefolia TaxID=1490495 RepID=A0A9W6XJ16_9STRA|nr:unnamed protein product [Phytophthora fragariaefolia]
MLDARSGSGTAGSPPAMPYRQSMLYPRFSTQRLLASCMSRFIIPFAMARPEDLFMDDFLFQEADAFALPLLDFDPEGALLLPAELTLSQTHQQQTQTLPFPDAGDCQPTSPVSTDDGSTDAEVSTPPPAFAQQQAQPRLCAETDVASSPAAKVAQLGATTSMHSPLPSEQKLLAPRISSSSMSSPSNAAGHMQKPMALAQNPTLFAGGLPYATPVAYFSPLNANQKRPCPQVLPGATSLNVGAPAAAAAAESAENDPSAKKTKREIRQMKNRESANKSRLRRKAQLTTLTTEVTELKKKEQDLQTIIAGLRAENKSLLDQNTFLRSLVTSFKHEPSSCQANHQMAAFVSLPPPVDQNCLALNMLESGKMGSELQGQPMDLTTTRPGKRRAVTSTLSTASMAVCASVFGITVFADYDGGVVDSGKIRSVGRVLHEAPTACGMDGCSTDSSLTVVGYVIAAVRSWWQFVSSSELVFGVLLNVLSFVAIVAVYQLWQSHPAGEWSWIYPMPSKLARRDLHRQTKLSSNKANTGAEKKRDARDVRLRDKIPHGSKEAFM